MVVILFGAPGVGKGTQAEILSQKLNFGHVSTGAAFRHAIANETPIGKIAAQYVAAGKLVPDEVVARIVEETLVRPEFSKGCILDGFPRTRVQAESLDAILLSLKREIHSVVNIKVDNSEIVKRLLARGRSDDSVEIIEYRMDVYNNETQPLLDYYASRGILFNVNGLGTVDEVSSRILTVLRIRGIPVVAL